MSQSSTLTSHSIVFFERHGHLNHMLPIVRESLKNTINLLSFDDEDDHLAKQSFHFSADNDADMKNQCDQSFDSTTYNFSKVFETSS